MHASNKTVSEDEEDNDVFPGACFIVAPVVTSEAVAGQLVGVFSMYASDTGHDEVFPIATPRGRSSKFP